MPKTTVPTIHALLLAGSLAGNAAANAGSIPDGGKDKAGHMIELVVTACRAVECRDVSLLYSAYEMSLMTCMIVGQRQAAAWTAQNPGWSVQRWNCRLHDRRNMAI